MLENELMNLLNGTQHASSCETSQISFGVKKEEKKETPKNGVGEDSLLREKILKAIDEEKCQTAEGISLFDLLAHVGEQTTNPNKRFAVKLLREQGFVPTKGKKGKRFWTQG